MLYTVKEISAITKVTIKTLHHYHKIGLLMPNKVSDAGYRLYGIKELERLQQILFYRELDFPLEQIKDILEKEPRRLLILSDQKELLSRRMKRMERLIQTLDESIVAASKGGVMEMSDMFKGFATEQQWMDAMDEQNQHLKEKYDYDMLENNPVVLESMNEMAIEAKSFMDSIAKALKNGLRVDDEAVQSLIDEHIEFLTHHGHEINRVSFAEQTRFFLTDDFHRNMLESQQTGLAYYLFVAASGHASTL
ncbi:MULTISPECIES: MerR family transcriptional regulator [unclassified Paenibacillus]|uniref:MerR family transcriptional regulator n=1 Tax=unclassified Paenibacillus TaxID=185978 RepID=UPI0036292C55